MKRYGSPPLNLQADLAALVRATQGLAVVRSGVARSSKPFPKSVDLEAALVPILQQMGFQHHVSFAHPHTGVGFEYDFWRPRDGVALEVMGYRADDEIYKDLLKFHVHEETTVGVVLVPRWKWVSGKRQERNYTETLKALAFADRSMAVRALVAVAYDWSLGEDGGWCLDFNVAS